MAKQRRKSKSFMILYLFLIVVITLGVFYFSTQETALPDTSSTDKININTEIINTSLIKLSETNNDVTLRYSWSTNDSSLSNCAIKKSLDIKFDISDFQLLESKPIITGIKNQFNIKVSNITLSGLKVVQNPCGNDKNEIDIKSLIKEQIGICNLVVKEQKPIISCEVKISIESSVSANFYGNVDGYMNLNLIKGEI